ncbi:MAG: GerMN domain-containing protein [Clostridiales bacterium]|nr:GerMN domain-containing protein [Clostridiales bacterium]
MKKIITALILAGAMSLTGCGLIPGSVSPSPSETVPSPSESARPVPSAQPSAPTGAEEVTAADYFPFKADVHRTYQGTGNEFAFFESWVDYIDNDAIQIRSNNGGTELVEVYTVTGGALKKALSLGEAYFRYDFTAEREIDEIMIMEPIAVGTEWTLESGEKRSITDVNADVTVPYGAFKALEVTTEYEDSTTKDYYVIGLGLIKKEFTTKETESMMITSDLEKYEEGSPLLENARFYYPDFNNDRLAYINQGLEFHTGDSILPQLEFALKTPPSGTELGRVMTDGATIRSITFDRTSGVVTIDLNKQFVTEMNAGTTMEGMILSSIANTLGSYFQTDKVQLTLEGGPYESGHMLFNLGDFLPFNPEDAVEYQG